LLNVFGGKITTFRKLAEHAMQRLQATFPKMGPDWTSKGILPGGEIEGADIPRFLDKLQREYAWLPRDLTRYYARVYGARTARVIDGAGSVAGLGRNFGPNFYEAEVRYLLAQEWAQTAEDILTRRTKHGLHMSAAEKVSFDAWFAGQMARSA
jgi:glycerol-3-phosphate dehydrogenase